MIPTSCVCIVTIVVIIIIIIIIITHISSMLMFTVYSSYGCYETDSCSLNNNITKSTDHYLRGRYFG